MATPRPVLDLITDIERPTVNIDQVAYLLRTSNDLTLDAYKTLERLAPRIAALLLATTLSPAEGQELSQLLDTACRFALVAPDEVHARLGDVNRMNIFHVFTELLTPSLPRAARATPAGAPVAGTKPSRGSNGSTAGPRTAGSRKSRSASSGRT